MEATTVKIYSKTKHALDELRTDHQSYDQIINKLIVESRKKTLVRELIAAYQQKADEDKEINKEWEESSAKWE
ncbi:TPA: hypothetical protein HA241_05965 [Candidatus Woesearchaeota archaeon]|nr:hypothetical protein [Candidatus Woesearchaeota archaeon]